VGGDITGRAYPLGRVAEEFSELCDSFAQVGCAVAYGLMPFGNLRTIDDGVALIDAAGNRNGGLMLDLWHIARSTSSFEEIRSLSPKYVLAVELDDADDQVRGTLLDDTLRHRRLCGYGTQDVSTFVEAVRATGFAGPWGVEIILTSTGVARSPSRPRCPSEPPLPTYVGDRHRVVLGGGYVRRVRLPVGRGEGGSAIVLESGRGP
jgi:sugar phosphate isomerase/epimerase